jgi:DNA-directed RNA polymerase subunit RPC12/RpoP
MSHGPLICRDCYTESEIEAVYQGSRTDTDDGLTCPNCGSASFGV